MVDFQALLERNKNQNGSRYEEKPGKLNKKQYKQKK